ncbi:MAG TPA: hypothetical protein VIJ37_06570, partial [Steroidobacteraceae bacterium]
TRAAGARQYVTDGQSGLLCDIDDVGGLADALRCAATDAALRERIVAGGWAAYEAEFERTRVVDRLLDTYRRAIEAGFRNRAAHPIWRRHTGA